MARREDFGPVRYWQIPRHMAGRHVIDTGVYAVEDLLIDTGPARCRDQVAQIVAEVDPGRVVLTHHHEDHVGNAALASAPGGRPPQIHPRGVDLVARSPELPFYRRAVWGTPDPFEAAPLGDRLETERFSFRVIHTPGHAPDHVALHEPDQDWLFVGDLYLGDRMRLGFSYEDVTEMIASIRKLLAIPDCVLFCSHTGYHAGHQQRLGRKLDFLLGLQQRAVMHFEEGCSISEITGKLGIRERWWRWISGGEYSGRNLVRGLLRDAGKIQ